MFPLLTERLLIRPLTQDDVAEQVRAVRESLDTVGRWLPWCTADYDFATASEWVTLCDDKRERWESFDLGMFDRADGALLGAISINDIRPAHQIGNIGYWLRQSAQGRGLMPEAVQAIIHFGFTQLGLTRLEIVAAVDNHASRRVAEKSGAQLEGIARNRLLIHRQLHDAAMYAIIPLRPRAPRPPSGR